MTRFVLIDGIVELEPGRFCAANKRFHPDDPVFQDHFPGYPVVPGALLTEAMAQTGGWALRAALDERTLTVLALIEQAKFRHPARPGEPLRLEARVTDRTPTLARVAATVRSDERKIASARLVFAIGARTSLPDDDLDKYESWRKRMWIELGAEQALRSGTNLA